NAEIIDILDQPPPEIVLPQPVHDRPRKERVLRGGHPSGEWHTNILFRVVFFSAAVEVFRDDSFLGLGMNYRALFGIVVLVFIVVVDSFDGAGGEEGGKAVEIVLLPFSPGMVVALRALEARAEKDLTDVGRVVGGVGVEGYVQKTADAVQVRTLAEE